MGFRPGHEFLMGNQLTALALQLLETPLESAVVSDFRSLHASPRSNNGAVLGAPGCADNPAESDSCSEGQECKPDGLLDPPEALPLRTEPAKSSVSPARGFTSQRADIPRSRKSRE